MQFFVTSVLLANVDDVIDNRRDQRETFVARLHRTMLPFHDEIQRDVSSSDSLVVLARGLGMCHAAARLIISTVSPSSLIIALNVSRPIATEVLYPTLSTLSHRLPSAHRSLLLPRFISADYTAKDRAHVYESGGFVVATSAVLVHDLLHNALPAANVKGVVVYAADAVREGSNEHFALKLFRARNKTGFVKAFSENAVALTRGFHHVEKLMRTLYVSRLCVWPRFHAAVKDAVSGHTPDLVDLGVQLTFRMKGLVSALREAVHAVLEDLRLATREVDFSELYREVEGGKKMLVYNFDDAVRRQLEGADVRVTGRVRALIADLAALRNLLRDVFELNAVAFYQRMVTMRHAAEQGNNWLVRKEAQRAVLLARSRVWVIRRAGQVGEVEGSAVGEAAASVVGESREVELNQARESGVRTVPTLEASPKWKALKDVLGEIQRDVEAAGAEADVGRVLVVVREQRVADELKAVLKDRTESFLMRQFETTFPSVAQRARESDELNKAHGGMHQMTMTQLAHPKRPRRVSSDSRKSEPVRNGASRKRRRPQGPGDSSGIGWKGDRSVEELQEVFREVKSDCSCTIEVLIWSREWVDLQGRGHRILEEYHPSFVVQYNSDSVVVREVEMFKAAHPGRPVRMYLLSHEDAAEEERFRSGMKRETAAFKSLIRERASMTIHVDQEGRQPEEEFTQALLDQGADDAQFSGRRGLGADRDSRKVSPWRPAVKKSGPGGKILVDTRELRSALPMLLYQSSMKIVPLTLEVGDFILSKNIGIERKSVPDLYGSFGSGRLFNQAEALCRHYKYPCLLIELDKSKPLSLSATSGGVPANISATSVVSKMVLLMQQFPSLRLLWAKGPHDAAEMFASLKDNEGEPDEEVAASLGVDTKDSAEDTFNAGPRALLRSLPGIDSTNLQRVMRQVRNVSTLISMSKEEMTELLGSPGRAAQLYDFVNEQPSEALAAL